MAGFGKGTGGKRGVVRGSGKTGGGNFTRREAASGRFLKAGSSGEPAHSAAGSAYSGHVKRHARMEPKGFAAQSDERVTFKAGKGSYAYRHAFSGRLMKNSHSEGLPKGRSKKIGYKVTMADGTVIRGDAGLSMGGQAARREPTGIGEVVAQASAIFGSMEAALAWLAKPSRWLENRSPYDLIRDGKRADVERYLGQVEYGVYV